MFVDILQFWKFLC